VNAYDHWVRSWLILNTPWQGTGNRHEWAFSGSDDAALRACLDRLDESTVTDPKDRWAAALVFGYSDMGHPRRAESAWTIDAALTLAEILPPELDDLRDDLPRSFTDRAAGWLGDAHTPPFHPE
jgi:hypothetical protein